jgi:hypothetical protein
VDVVLRQGPFSEKALLPFNTNCSAIVTKALSQSLVLGKTVCGVAKELVQGMAQCIPAIYRTSCGIGRNRRRT